MINGSKSNRDAIIHLAMQRRFEKNGVKLPPKYWNLPEYKQEYAHQIRGYYKLTKAYSETVILKVFQRERWCFSLHNESLVGKISQENNIEKTKQQQTQPLAKPKIQNTSDLANEDIPLFRK